MQKIKYTTGMLSFGRSKPNRKTHSTTDDDDDDDYLNYITALFCMIYFMGFCFCKDFKINLIWYYYPSQYSYYT